MKVQGNRYINNPEMIKNKVEKKTTVPQNIISEDDVKISDSARKLVETARNKVSDFHTMHFSSINGEIREIPAEYKCENLFKLDLYQMHLPASIQDYFSLPVSPFLKHNLQPFCSMSTKRNFAVQKESYSNTV